MIGAVKEGISYYADVLDMTAGRTVVRASTGRLYTVYRHREEVGSAWNALYCAYSDDGGETWTEEEIDSDISNGTYGYVVAAIDSEDNLHIAYFVADVGSYPDYPSIYYRKRNAGGGWENAEQVDSSEYAGELRPCMAGDSADHIHVVYGTWTEETSQLRHREKIGDTWQDIEIVVADTGAVDIYPGLAVGSDDSLHVVFHYGADVAYIKKSGGSWGNIETVRPGGDAENTVICLDSSDKPHISWTESDIPMYSRSDGAGNWIDAENVSGAGSGVFLSIAADQADKIYVVWVEYEDAGDHKGDTMWVRMRDAAGGWLSGRQRVFPVGHGFS
jgi:hypothetical protein